MLSRVEAQASKQTNKNNPSERFQYCSSNTQKPQTEEKKKKIHFEEFEFGVLEENFHVDLPEYMLVSKAYHHF